MRFRWAKVMIAALFIQFCIAPNAESAVTSFTPSIGTSALFDGEHQDYVKVTNSNSINMSSDSFTISWWQYTEGSQTLFPRILQFGGGNTYTDYFAISEERDGNIYLWINGINITNISIPSVGNWHHITISREGYNYTWFLDGVWVKTTEFVSTIPCDGCLAKFATVDTSLLDIYLGGGNDSVTGTFTGNLAGFQIQKGVRWPGTSTFSPPTNFESPSSGLLFSFYGDTTIFSDKSGNNLTVTNTGAQIANFLPVPKYEVSASVAHSDMGRIGAETRIWTDSATAWQSSYDFLVDEGGSFRINVEPARGYAIDYLLIDGNRETDTAVWNGSRNFILKEDVRGNVDIEIFFKLVRVNSVVTVESDEGLGYFNEATYFESGNPTNPNNYSGVDGIIMSLPVFIESPTGVIQQTTCFMDVGLFQLETDSSTIGMELPSFRIFTDEFFPYDCESPRSEAFPDGVIIPRYSNGLFGQDSVTVTFSLFASMPEDITDLSTSLETLTVSYEIPAEISSVTITSADPEPSGTGELYFGDTLTMTTINSVNASYFEILVEVPEAESTSELPEPRYCTLFFDLNEVNRYSFPSESAFMSTCREQWDGEWELDRTIERSVYITLLSQSMNRSSHYLFTVPALDPPAPAPAPAPEPAPAPAPEPAPAPAPAPEPAPAPVEEVKVTDADLVVVAEPVIEREIEIEENLPSEDKTESAPVQLVQKEVSKPPVKKRCTKKGVHIFTKSGLLQICDEQLNLVLGVPACAGKSSTPTYPWTFRAQRFKPGYTNTQSGLKLYYSVFFFKGLAIAGVDKVSKAPCSNGSVFIQKKYSKEVYEYIKVNDPLIYVKAS